MKKSLLCKCYKRVTDGVTLFAKKTSLPPSIDLSLLTTFAPTMRLNKYLRTLLLEHDCVIVPRFGGFVARMESAYFDAETALWYPPHRSVSFNAGLKMNDGLLAQLYMQMLDSSYPEALRALERDTEELQVKLQETGIYEFEGLGTISQEEAGRYVFTPESEGGIAAPELYGLRAVALREDKESQTTEPQPEDTGSRQAEVTIEEDRERAAEPSPYYVIRLHKRFVHGVAAVVAAIFFYFGLATPVGNQSPEEGGHVEAGSYLLAAFPIEQAQPKAAITTGAAEEQGMTPATMTQPAAEEHEAEIESPVYYTIVLASDVREANAQDFVAQLSKSGCEGAEILLKNDRRRVVYGRFETESEAYNTLRTLRRTLPSGTAEQAFIDGWVYRVK